MDDDRIAQLNQKIQNARGVDQKQAEEKNKDLKNKQTKYNGIQAGTELVVAIFAGGAIGYGLDHYLGTLPLFLITFFFLGTCTGFYNVYKLTTQDDLSVGIHKKKTSEKDEKNLP